jgi:hypothetical protein
VRFLLLALLGLITAVPAAAHPAPFSYLDLVLRGGNIEGMLVLHVVDAAHDLGITPEDRLLDPAVAAMQRDRLVALIAPRFTLRADGQVLTPDWQELEVVPDRHGVLIRFRVLNQRPGALGVQTAMFPYDPVHQTFVNVYEGEELRQQMIFAAGSPERVFYSGSTQGVLAVMGTFVPSGIEHIMIGPDHILFLIGLLLLGGTWTALVKIVTAFTAGHSVTLSLAALNIVTPSPQIIEPAIALSIVFVGADNLVRGSGRDVRAWAALVFGLVHGFGFSAVLKELGLPPDGQAWSLLLFNLGVEAGQAGVILAAIPFLIGLRRASWRPGAVRVMSLAVLAVAIVLFVERAFFA